MFSTSLSSIINRQGIRLKALSIDELWRPVDININESLLVTLGGLTLVIRHEPQEWSIAYDWQQDHDDEEPTCMLGNNQDFTELDKNIHRYAYSEKTNTLQLRPKLADRSVVARPRVPFNLLAKQQANLYVSTPLWLEIVIGDNVVLKEIPVFRLSDTWFGANTIEGEVAYATRTHARLRLNEVSFNQYRAITPLVLINDTDDSILLERISLPVPLLHLFSDQHKNLWTSPLSIVRESNNGTSIKIESSCPAEISQATELASPRQNIERNAFTKTLHVLFG